MTYRTIETRNRIYTVSMDNDVQPGARLWAIASWRILDELSQEPVRGRITATTTKPGLTTRIARDGLVGLVGIPNRVFHDLNITDDQVDLMIHADGYISRYEEITIDHASNPDFPTNYVPPPPEVIYLHRQPVEFIGRTVAVDGNDRTAVSNATVRISGIRRSLPPSDIMPPPADAPDIVSLRPPLYLNRDVASGTLRRREMVPVGGEEKYLTAEARSGDTHLNLTNRINLAPGNLIVIDEDDPDRVEYLTIDTVSEAASTAHPAIITVTLPLAYTHHIQTRIESVTPQPPGAANAFGQNAARGDCCVFLGSMNEITGSNVVEISAGGDPRNEYHTLQTYITTSDSDGYYRMPPLSRVAMVELQAENGGEYDPVSIEYIPDYSLRENRLDFVFQ